MANAYKTLTGMVAPIAEHMFEDIEGDANADDIARISPNGLMITTGTTNTTYSPDDPVIRAHMALFLTRLYERVAGSEAPAADTEFTDIAERNAEQQAAIGQLFGLGVTTGTSATTYSPSDNVTREQMASFVARMYRVLDALPQAPGAPAALTATPHGTAGNALAITWAAPDSGTSDITGYVVQWGTNYNSQQTTTGTTATIHGLTAGTAHSVRVAAVSADGQGDWATTTGTPGTPPGPISDLNAWPGASPGSINVSWTAPADDGDAPITGYKIEWARGNEAARQSVRIGPATSHTLSGLHAAALYYVWVTATNAAGDGETSYSASAIPTGNAASGIVKINHPPRPDSTGGRFASITWPTVSPGFGQTLLTYTIQRKCGTQVWPDAIIPNDARRILNQGAQNPAVTAEGATRTAHQMLVDEADGTTAVALLGGPATDPTLENGVECTYRVRGNTFVDANGNGTHDLSEPTVGKWVEGKATPMATTAAPAVTGTPTVPVTAVVALRGHRTVQVNWTLPERGTDEGTGGAIAGYRVMLMSPAQAPPAPSVVAVAANVSATTDSHTFKGLNNGWEYTPIVVPLNARGAGPAGSRRCGEPLCDRARRAV